MVDGPVNAGAARQRVTESDVGGRAGAVVGHSDREADLGARVHRVGVGRLRDLEIRALHGDGCAGLDRVVVVGVRRGRVGVFATAGEGRGAGEVDDHAIARGHVAEAVARAVDAALEDLGGRRAGDDAGAPGRGEAAAAGHNMVDGPVNAGAARQRVYEGHVLGRSGAVAGDRDREADLGARVHRVGVGRLRDLEVGQGDTSSGVEVVLGAVEPDAVAHDRAAEVQLLAGQLDSAVGRNVDPLEAGQAALDLQGVLGLVAVRRVRVQYIFAREQELARKRTRRVGVGQEHAEPLTLEGAVDVQLLARDHGDHGVEVAGGELDPARDEVEANLQRYSLEVPVHDGILAEAGAVGGLPGAGGQGEDATDEVSAQRLSSLDDVWRGVAIDVD